MKNYDYEIDFETFRDTITRLQGNRVCFLVDGVFTNNIEVQDDCTIIADSEANPIRNCHHIYNEDGKFIVHSYAVTPRYHCARILEITAVSVLPIFLGH